MWRAALLPVAALLRQGPATPGLPARAQLSWRHSSCLCPPTSRIASLTIQLVQAQCRAADAAPGTAKASRAAFGAACQGGSCCVVPGEGTRPVRPRRF